MFRRSMLGHVACAYVLLLQDVAADIKVALNSITDRSDAHRAGFDDGYRTGYADGRRVARLVLIQSSPPPPLLSAKWA